MLVIKVYATKQVPIRAGRRVVPRDARLHSKLELVDEIYIQNVGERGEDNWEYKIKKPRGVKAKIIHLRADGYRPLLIKALKLLEHLPKKRKRRKKDG